jgi:dTDP-4-dehydrorhamnose 3,5-epimerase
MLEVIPTAIPDVLHIKTKSFGDERGYFAETYNKRVFSQSGVSLDFVQDNQSLSKLSGTVRGLHFQTEPYAQAKLVRVLKGRILDVAVDMRRSSATFGKHVAIELGDNSLEQLFVPVGFAHGFCTLEPDTEVLYKVSNFYAPQHDRGVLWNDPALGIKWPVSAERAVLSEKDSKQPAFRELENVF